MFGVRDVEVLRGIVRLGSFRRAAEALGMSQSAVSNRIATLERRLGVLLFDRSRRRAVLTAQGRRFLEEAERMVLLRDRIASQYGPEGNAVGTLRLGVAETIVHTMLSAILKTLRSVSPAPRIELMVETSPVLAERLVANAIDVAVLMRQFVPPEATSHAVGRFEMGWYADAAFERTGGAGGHLRIDDLLERALVTFARGSLPHRDVERIFARPDAPAPLVHACAPLTALSALVEDGTGFGTLPRAFAAQAAREGRMVEVEVEPDLRLPPLEFAACWLRDPGSDVTDALRAVSEAPANDRSEDHSAR